MQRGGWISVGGSYERDWRERVWAMEGLEDE